MEYKELKKKTVKELHKILKQYREKLRDTHFKVSAKQLKNIREIRTIKKVIAQVLTLLNNQPEIVKEEFVSNENNPRSRTSLASGQENNQ